MMVPCRPSPLTTLWCSQALHSSDAYHEVQPLSCDTGGCRLRTQGRLTEVYDQAPVIEFDDTDKFILFSDLHRGDGSSFDEFAKNKMVYSRALTHYLDNDFTYIEAGDGDELWEHTKYKWIVRAHGLVWERIKIFHQRGRYIRLWGNHDIQLSDPDFVRDNLTWVPDINTGLPTPLLPGLKPLEAVVLKHRHTGQEILVVHGHQGDFANDQAWRFTVLTFRLFWRRLHALGIKSPSSPVRNAFKRHKVERNYVKWIRRHRTALICGHTHREVFPKIGDVPYFNIGSGVYPGYITGIEIVDGAIALVGWRVEPDEEGTLQVVGRQLRQPIPLTQFYLSGPKSD